MTQQEAESWKKFCQTGFISDYLEYRGAVNFAQKNPELPEGGGDKDADFHSGRSGTGTSPR